MTKNIQDAPKFSLPLNFRGIKMAVNRYIISNLQVVGHEHLPGCVYINSAIQNLFQQHRHNFLMIKLYFQMLFIQCMYLGTIVN